VSPMVSLVFEADQASLVILGIALVFVGIILIVAALIRSSTSKAENDESKVRGAGVILIGPIPIIFGTDKKAVKTILALALTLSIVILLIYVVFWLLR
jgi:uncharacterized protein (TIGR00304 family)